MRREYAMKFGTQVLNEGVRFRLWAPKVSSVAVHIDDLDRDFPMETRRRGWFEASVADAKAGMAYRFRLDSGETVPDPAARYLPQDVSGVSEIIDPLDFRWSDRGWTGRPWEETLLYEIHIGTFTPEGTFRAAIDRLDHLVDLGINTIQLMPIADFPGRWNWGYDGGNLFAVEHRYGRPEDFKAFVDGAHRRGLSVMLDVVYNHFGPKGNHIESYAPLTTDTAETPWGPAINFDAEGSAMVRELMMANARYWLTEYHLDGLRLDASHEIYDDGPRHVLQELAEQCRAATDGRHVHLVLENSLNQVHWLERRMTGAPYLYDAQWGDDIHHALHSMITGEDAGYYRDFAGRLDLVGRALAKGVSWQGEYMEHEGRHKGEPSAFLPPSAFIGFMQNHDQLGNRPFGERTHQLVSPRAYRMWVAISLLCPQIPMLFMGEEWAADTPFYYFSDLGDDLADAIRKGRREEAHRFPGIDDKDLPDPMAERTFQASKLDWSEREAPDHEAVLALYKRLIALRQREIVPRLVEMGGHAGRYEVEGPILRLWWHMGDGAQLSLIGNFSDQSVQGGGITEETLLWLEGEADKTSLGAWSVAFHLAEIPPLAQE